MMGSSKTGQEMIEQQIRQYEASGGLFGLGKKKVTIVEFDDQNGYANSSMTVTINPDFRLGVGNSTDPDGQTLVPPIVVFFHELGHINQFRSHSWEDWYEKNPDGSLKTRRNSEGKLEYIPLTDSSGQPLIERQNVGLSWDTSRVPNANGDTYDPRYTENGFRDELNLPDRERY